MCVCVFRGRAASPIGRHGRLSMCDGEPADRISGSLELEYINLFLFTLGACVVISKFFLLGGFARSKLWPWIHRGCRWISA